MAYRGVYWSDGSGRLNLIISRDDAAIGSHSGDCEGGIRFLLSLPHIASQIDQLDKENIRANLREYGAWDETELADDDMCRVRTLWLACGDILDGDESEQDEGEI